MASDGSFPLRLTRATLKLLRDLFKLTIKCGGGFHCKYQDGVITVTPPLDTRPIFTGGGGTAVFCVQIVTIGSTTFTVRDIKDDGTVDPAQTPYTVYAYTRDENFNVGVAPLSACRPTPIVAKTLLIWQQSIRVGTQMIDDWWTVDVFYKVC